ncbi:hypothetical protein CAPTEDRAFT_183258 [Capitella teleta]|uniref:Arpin n=1 Tax=Capitella teleta TaxID=283909 RepID=R7TQY8_CAPTE|nr:hypothetical protein CAPTEDRAFT_183258 [Capitella teleta]|eukprot:ELT93906.1 hypothetical protein CAPTEDRAFT_183258 [Capitella teleta]
MSRIYSNDPLQNLPVVTYQWNGSWNPADFAKGKGVLLEGILKKKSRHVIDDNTTKQRFCVLHLKVNRAHRRQYDSSGNEIEPNFSEKGKVRTGFLHSSYKTSAKGESDHLDEGQMKDAMEHAELMKVTEKVKMPGTIAFWIEESQLTAVEINVNDSVRLRTRGDGPFIDTVAVLTPEPGTVSNYTGGEEVGCSWTDKVMTFKSQDEADRLPQEENEGVDEDEWD